MTPTRITAGAKVAAWNAQQPPEWRVARARKAAIAMHAKHDPHATTAKATEVFLSRFPDPEARSEYFRTLSRMAVAARHRTDG